MKPLLIWPGHKRKLAKKIVDMFPKGFGTYQEPFFGSGAVFFEAHSRGFHVRGARLSDTNRDLVNFYYHLTKSPHCLHGRVMDMVVCSSESYYYRIRDYFNAIGEPSGFERAACFLYLNRAGYRGNYRLNSKGLYNVPYGHCKTVNLPGLDDFLAMSYALERAPVTRRRYATSLVVPVCGDVVYADPPYYTPGADDAFYPGKFGRDDQIALAKRLRQLSNEGVTVITSNADDPFIRDLYDGFKIETIEHGRGFTQRRRSELLISNI